MEKEDNSDVLIPMRNFARFFNEKEAFIILNKKISEKDIEIGKLKSEIQELKYTHHVEYTNKCLKVKELKKQLFELSRKKDNANIKIESDDILTKELIENLTKENQRLKEIINNHFDKLL